MIKRVCQFLPDREQGKPDAKLRYRIKWNHNRNIVARNVGYRINIDKWSWETQRCKVNTTHGKKKVPASIINREIQRFEGIAEETFTHFEQSNKSPSAAEFRAEFDKRLYGNKLGQDTLFDVYAVFIKKTGELNSWSTRTMLRHESVRRHLQNHNPGLTFGDLSEDTLFAFMRYMQSKESMQLRYSGAEQGMKNTTIAKNVEQIREFLRWAKKNGHYNGDLHETFHPKFKGTDGSANEVIHLSWNELMRLYAFEFKQKHLSRVRDVFCFMCFTSLRYSDVAKLTREDVKEDHIRVVTKKTVNGLRIDLNKYSRAILEKYKDEKLPYNNALPVIANINMNKYLKTMGEAVGFNESIRIVYFIGAKRYEEVKPKYELLTTHCGRRTFVVNSLLLGIPAEVVMSWTGHSDYDAMRPYIKIVDELKNASMKKFDEFSPSSLETGTKDDLV
jgi:integrase